MSLPSSPAYDRLKDRFARIATLQEIDDLLEWDEPVMMPAGAADARSTQTKLLKVLKHRELTDPVVARDLEQAEADFMVGSAAAMLPNAADAAKQPHRRSRRRAVTAPPNAWGAANLKLMRHSYTRATAINETDVQKLEVARSKCSKARSEALDADDFSKVQAPFEELVNLVRQKANQLADKLAMSPYDALLDEHQRGIGAGDAVPLFNAYSDFIATALPKALKKQFGAPPMLRLVPDTALESLCRRLQIAAGLEPNNSRLDRSDHPFATAITLTDVRVTLRRRNDEVDFLKSLFDTMHETWHALYWRGLPSDFLHQPVGQHAGTALHESQSLLGEMQVCRSDHYLKWLTPELYRAFGHAGAYRPDELAARCRRVARSLIRIDADELTYPAHVILRFELEQRLVSGALKVENLPKEWDDGMYRLLGIRPSNLKEGCLQDPHWFHYAYFGYFPCYALGAMAAAQLMAAARRSVSGLDAALERGDMSPLLGWLRENVHAKGSLLGFNDLLKAATGKALDFDAFNEYLTKRYL